MREGLGLVGWGAMLPRLEVMWARLGAILALRGAMLVHLSSYVAPAAFGFGVGGLELVGRGLCCRVWGWWVEVGQWWVVLLGLGLVGWGWLVSGGLCFWVWGWWVGVGQWCFVRLGLGLVGWGWSVVVCACRYGIGVGVGQWWVVL